jgi:predicted SprT family Zn-dependent metalloprotease
MKIYVDVVHIPLRNGKREKTMVCYSCAERMSRGFYSVDKKLTEVDNEFRCGMCGKKVKAINPVRKQSEEIQW